MSYVDSSSKKFSVSLQKGKSKNPIKKNQNCPKNGCRHNVLILETE